MKKSNLGAAIFVSVIIFIIGPFTAIQNAYNFGNVGFMFVFSWLAWLVITMLVIVFAMKWEKRSTEKNFAYTMTVMILFFVLEFMVLG